MTYRWLPHTADVKVAIEGESLEQLFHDGVAVVRELVAGETGGRGVEARRLSLRAAGADELFFQFLKELLYWFNTDAFVPSTISVDSIDRDHVEGVVRGEPFDARRHQAQPEVKAVTRHQLEVRPAEDGWTAQLVFDM